MSYVVRGPYQIIRNTARDSYFVRKLHKPDGSELKFMIYDLYPLSPYIKPCEPIDTTDTRYINQSYAPLVNPLMKSPHIELYNDCRTIYFTSSLL